MDLLQSLDVAVFRFINGSLSNPVFDQLMPFSSYNSFFFPTVFLLGIWMIWKWRLRAAICLLFVILVAAVGDGQIIRPLKLLIARPRPLEELDSVIALVGRGKSFGMPSAHAANWFSATVVMFIYFRKSLYIMVPMALLVSFSRIYNGAHYPSDVIVGGILGAGYGAGAVWGLDALWKWAGPRWFPLWWSRLPALMNPQLHPAENDEEPQFAPRGEKPGPARHHTIDAHWLKLGYIFIGVSLLLRLAYIAGDTIQLSEDEAYQWLWSKNLALSYYSKPPLIAYVQFIATHLWGDTQFGVRFFSPVIGALTSLLLLRFLAREVNARAGFFFLLAITATLLMSAGSILMTVDPLSVLFWTGAMIAGWRAVQPDASTRHWLYVGLWTALGFLSKYTALFQILCWAVFFLLHRPARQHIKRPGPWLALVPVALASLPVLIWNSQHDWITAKHVAFDNAGANRPWEFTLRYVGDFLGAEVALLNPVFFVAVAIACIAFWRRHRQHPLMLFLFSMGAPVFIVYLLWSFRSRILPNWIAPSVLPLFCLAVVYWDLRWRLGQARRFPVWFSTGMILGALLVAVGLDTNLVAKATRKPLPAKIDPLRRVRGWDVTAKITGEARQQLAAEGEPVFIIGDHYGVTSQICFYLPEARAAAATNRFVYYLSSPNPRNQFYFWPGYQDRHGQHAIFVRDLGLNPKPKPPPDILIQQFESIEDLGIHAVKYRGKILRHLQLHACRNLK